VYELLWLLPILPFAGFVILATAGARFPKPLVAVVGAGSVGVSAVITLVMAAGFFFGAAPAGHAVSQTLWSWIPVDGLRPAIAFYLDPLAVIMCLVVTGVGFLIHLYSTEFMLDDEDYSRFFAYMNLFVGSMLTLVLADNLLLLYLGWEGVGLCSYLLIGFWYKDPANSAAAQKAFIVTRVGDAAMAIGLFLLFTRLGTFNIQELMTRAAHEWPVGSGVAAAAAILLLGGAVGKSAQLPLQTWLPDAMAGPTPVSALIHAATMVTAGVYLIARTHVLFALAPGVMVVVAIVGAATLLVAGFAALGQRDIKRVLAYSTISQLGYMFLALGVGAWGAAIFHLMIHAFFKSLLFLGAGAVILALHHEHDMFKMGGLRTRLPVTFWTFLIAGGALSGFPLITAGFYSKDLIIWDAFSSRQGSALLWVAALFGAFITGLYTFRMIFVTFFGEAKMEVSKHPGFRIKLVLLVLGVLSVIGGWVELPPSLGNVPLFTRFLHAIFPEVPERGLSHGTETFFEVISAVTVLAAVYLAYLWFHRKRWEEEDEARLPLVGHGPHLFLKGGLGFDTLYNALFVQPYLWITRVNRGDVVDRIYAATAWAVRVFHLGLRTTENGRLRWYATGIVIGSVVVLAVMVYL
jgi:NADH-quinone oxidoreductase subunit L